MVQPRTPTAIKHLTKTTRPDRANLLEPTPLQTKPIAPSHLSDKAKGAFRRFADLLDQIGVVTTADAIALERLASCYADILDLSEKVAKDGYVYEQITDSGAKLLRANPAASLLADADRRLRNYLNDFGMSPASRAKVSVLDKSKQEDLETYFRA